MTSKGILRYAIAVVILCLLLSIVLPFFGIPRTAIVPPPLDYLQASGTTTGYIIKRDRAPTNNLFHVGDENFFIRYQFRAPALPPPGQHVALTPTAVYKGHAQVDQSFHDAAKIGDTVPVKFDPINPAISGLNVKGGGRNVDGDGSLLGWWIAWELGILAVAYPLSMLLERLFLRESY